MVEPLKAAGPSRVPVPFCRRVYIQGRPHGFDLQVVAR